MRPAVWSRCGKSLSLSLIAAHLKAGVILVATVYSDRYIIPPPPQLHIPPPFPHFSPSLISLMVYVGVKHHVYQLTYSVCVCVCVCVVRVYACVRECARAR